MKILWIMIEKLSESILKLKEELKLLKELEKQSDKKNSKQE